MSAHAILNLLNELAKKINLRFDCFLAINSIIQEHKC